MGRDGARPGQQGPHTRRVPIDPSLVPFLEAMFPRALHADLRIVLTVLDPGLRNDHFEAPPFLVEGERLQLLARFYSPEPSRDALTDLTARQKLILTCLYSRHHDGRVREAHLRTLEGDEPWLPVFVLRLVSEYVIQIGQVWVNGGAGTRRSRRRRR